ncbi:hypothetical protein B296_00006148 [Ensete ventricosum]|uniref:Uncharacterized protein n=1 Tax=Ensete ventricosum TaxID=4639 RepID=A0A427ASY5_ENSVE|nr:hypothetical protein B296_00006148 [Ensete ventricosum]
MRRATVNKTSVKLGILRERRRHHLEHQSKKKSHIERLTTVKIRLNVLEASLEELYHGQKRLLGVESSQEEVESQIKKVKSLVDRLMEDTKDSVQHLHEVRGIANSKDSILMQGLVHGRRSVHGHPKAQDPDNEALILVKVGLLQCSHSLKGAQQVTGQGRASGQSEDDAVGNSRGVCWELAEGIESLPGWRKRVCRKKTETRRKIVGGSRKAYQELERTSLKISRRSLGTRREIAGRRP